mmetsp:Transcript_27633/g.60839  ORF Transcript_27633/g.60839 Transcript_27633/m.60839 type:complete len:233 (-) Transcript_27633:113-811(-)
MPCLIFGHGFESNDDHQGQGHIVSAVNVDEVALANGSDPVLVHLDDFFSALLDGEVVLQDGSVDVPIGVILDLDDEVVPDDADHLFLDLGNLLAVGVLDGHGIADPELAFLDGVEGGAVAAGLQVEGFPHAQDLVVGKVGRSSSLVAPSHAVDGEGIAKGQEFFPHAKGLGGAVVLFLGRRGLRFVVVFFSLVVPSVGNGGSEGNSASDGNGGPCRVCVFFSAVFSPFASFE